MSREWPDYNESSYPPEFWEQAVKQAINGKRGQKALRELEAALLAMKNKRLIDGALCKEGEVCALGAMYMHKSPNKLKGWLELQEAAGFESCGTPSYKDQHPYHRYGEPDLSEMGTFGREELGLTYALAASIAEENDWGLANETPEQRYERVLAWVRRQLKPVEVA